VADRSQAVGEGPRNAAEFIEHARTLVRAGRDHDLLLLADRYGQKFHGQFTAEELNQLEGMFEGAQMVIDLEEWSASRASGTAVPDGVTEDSATPVATPRGVIRSERVEGRV
jgi:hypothetical protein